MDCVVPRTLCWCLFSIKLRVSLNKSPPNSKNNCQKVMSRHYGPDTLRKQSLICFWIEVYLTLSLSLMCFVKSWILGRPRKWFNFQYVCGWCQKHCKNCRHIFLLFFFWPWLLRQFLAIVSNWRSPVLAGRRLYGWGCYGPNEQPLATVSQIWLRSTTLWQSLQAHSSGMSFEK